MNDFDSSLFFTLTGFLQDIDQTLGLSQFSGSLRIVCWEPLEGAERDNTPGIDKRAITICCIHIDNNNTWKCNFDNMQSFVA